MKPLFTLLATLLCVTAAPARDHGAPRVIPIWNNATAPHSNGITAAESEPEPDRLENTTAAELYLYAADPARDTGLAVVICPGGGYMRLCMDYEGYDVARWFAAQGITAAVLKYRLPNGHPEVPLEDAEQALRILRGEAPGAEGHTASCVGVAGFSAGGHLAAALSTLGAVRPDFSILFYAVTADGPLSGCRITFDRLLGEDGEDPATVEAWTPLRHITQATPPTLLFHSDDDPIVPPTNSTAYYEGLKRFGTPAALHVYPTGGHGWGILDAFVFRDDWQRTLLDWLGRLPAPAAEKTEKTEKAVPEVPGR